LPSQIGAAVFIMWSSWSLVLGERGEDAEAQHEAVQQHVHQHAEADHAQPRHRQPEGGKRRP
jgi:hypothetical protein